jgi:hypothetical protein
MAFTASDCEALLKDPRSFLDGIYFTVAGDCFQPSKSQEPDQLTFGEPDRPQIAYRLTDVGSGGDSGMIRIPVYKLRKATNTDGKAVIFDAYLVEYEAGKTPQTVLWNKATLCFTANMNGCTFGIGSQIGPADPVLVTHSNSQGMGSDAARAQDQRSNANAVIGDGGVLLEPEHYRTYEKQALTFGFRSTGQKWKFCYLSYRRFLNPSSTLALCTSRLSH